MDISKLIPEPPKHQRFKKENDKWHFGTIRSEDSVALTFCEVEWIVRHRENNFNQKIWFEEMTAIANTVYMEQADELALQIAFIKANKKASVSLLYKQFEEFCTKARAWRQLKDKLNAAKEN
jgi:hypothetical protein